MPDEPNKRMDDLLKSYAKQRREDAGAPLEMHPATRRMLQTEVAKFAAQEDASESWAELFARYKPFVILAGGLAALAVAAVAWFALQPGPSQQLAKNEDQAASMSARPARAAASQARGAVESEGKDFPLLADAHQQPQKKTAAFGLDTETARSQSPAPGAMAAGRFDGGLTAEEQRSPDEASVVAAVDELRMKEADKLEAPKLQMNAAATPPSASVAAQPAGPPMTAPTVAAKSKAAAEPRVAMGNRPLEAPRHDLDFEQAEVQRFNRSDERTAGAGGGKAGGAAQVLNSFSWSQSGNTVRVLDEDGSTYEGTIGVATDDLKGDRLARKPGVYQKTEKQAEEVTRESRSSQRQAAGVAFRVAGTNRSLGQMVVFEGNLIAEPDVVGQTKQADAAGSARSQVAGEMSLQNTRIEGRARIGVSQEIEINAVPATK